MRGAGRIEHTTVVDKKYVLQKGALGGLFIEASFLNRSLFYHFRGSLHKDQLRQGMLLGMFVCNPLSKEGHHSRRLEINTHGHERRIVANWEE